MEEGAREQQNTPPSRIYVERTLALIKPDAVDKADEIEEMILGSGFTVLQVIMHHIIVIEIISLGCKTNTGCIWTLEGQ